MRKHFAFPPLDHETTWTDTAGNVVQAAEPQEGDARVNQSSLSRDGIERRNAFLQGQQKPKPRRQDSDEEPQEAERIPQLQSRDEMRANAARMLVSRPSEGHEADTISRQSFQRQFSFGDKGQRSDDARTLSKHAGFVPGHATKAVTFREDSVSYDVAGKSSVDMHVKSSFDQTDKQATDLPLAFKGSGVMKAPVSAVVGRLDRDDAMDLILDILAEHGTEAPVTALATQVADLAARLRNDLRLVHSVPKQSSHQSEALQSNTVELQETPSLTNDTEGRIASDIQHVVQHANSTEWKSDPLLQQRAGMWAAHVASKRTGMTPQALQAGFKAKGLQALGRLALQLLSTASATQRFDAKSLPQMDASRHVRGVATADSAAQARSQQTLKSESDLWTRDATEEPLTKQRIKAAVSDMQTFFRNEAIQHDLQSMQNGLELDTTADEVFDAFVETMRNDDLDEDSAGSRIDAFQKLQADAEYQRRSDRQRPANATREVDDEEGIGRVGLGSTVRFRTDQQGPASGSKVQDTQAQGSLGNLKHDLTREQTAFAFGSNYAKQASASFRSSEIVFENV